MSIASVLFAFLVQYSLVRVNLYWPKNFFGGVVGFLQ